MGWIDSNDDYEGNEYENWWLFRDDNGQFIQKIGLLDDIDLDYYVENPLEASLEGWTVVSYNEQDHHIFVK